MANLILYYSSKGENYWAGGVKDIAKGNTERIAEFIQQAVGGDLFEVETVKDYPADYFECIDEAQAELRANARPEVKAMPDVTAYDTIFVGYPNWWGTMPMCLFTVLENLDLSGKRVVAFCTSEGSGFGKSLRDLKKLAKGAHVEQGIAIIGNRAADSEAEVATWAAQYKA